MPTKRDCIAAAKKAGNLTDDEASQVVEALLEEKNRVKALKAEGKVANATQALAEAWTQRMDAERMARALQSKHAAINIIKRQEANAQIQAAKDAGFGASDGLQALLGGSNKRFAGARDSIDSGRRATYKDTMGGVLNELEQADATMLRQFKESAEFNDNVVREMTAPGSTKDATARSAAGILGNLFEMLRLRLNDAGANIGRLEGYFPQHHNGYRLTARRKDGKHPREGWIDDVLPLLDMERTFPELTGDAVKIRGVLSDIYDNIVIGKEQGPNAIERGEYQSPRNFARSMGQHRVLHFKDAESTINYNRLYGSGNVLDIVRHHVDAASRKLSLMERLGPNPEVMLQSLIAEQERLLVESMRGGTPTKAQEKELAKLRNAWTGQTTRTGQLHALFAELTGETGWAVNPTVARYFAIGRATQTLSKLGGASLSAIADIFTKAMNMRLNGSTWPEALFKGVTQYFEIYGGKKTEVARQLGSFIDNVMGDICARWDVAEGAPGKLAALQNKLFKWSGLNWFTERGKAGYSMWLAQEMGNAATKTFDELAPNMKAMLKYHGFDARRWELMRHMTESVEDMTLLTPQRVDQIPDAMVREALSPQLDALRKRYKGDVEGFAAAEGKLMERYRRDLRTEVMSLYSDETMYAIIEPDANTTALMRQGTRPGTVAGEFWRTVMQFKSFPIAYMQRQIGGRRWIRGELQEGMRRGFKDAVTTDIPGMIGAGLSAWAFGYMAMTAKDIAKGKEPRDPLKKETIFAALMQSGGAGIFGDFLFGEVNRYGNSFLETMAGPLAGEVGRAVSVLKQLAHGELQGAGEDTLRVALDNMPFVNLWYTREAMNWLLFYHIREALSPGTLARTERRMQENFGQQYLFSPAGAIQRGGGFR